MESLYSVLFLKLAHFNQGGKLNCLSKNMRVIGENVPG